MLVSVIVPIYNVERYLNRCIESIIHQSYKDIEIILVDDGSSDMCPVICDEWAQKDHRIKAVHKQNAGLGYARNTGLEVSTGDAVIFIDSDDYILPETIEYTAKAMWEQNADIVCFGHQDLNANGKIIRAFMPSPEQWLYEGVEVQSMFLPNLIAADPVSGKSFNIPKSAWGSLFSMKVIQKNNWRFVSEREIISEDVYSLLKLYRNINKVVILPQVFYCYCKNATSLTHMFREDRYERIKDFYKKTIILCDECRYDNQVKERLKQTFVSFSIAAMKMIQQSELNISQKVVGIKKICYDNTMCLVLKGYHNKYDSKPKQLFCHAVRKKQILIVYILLLIRNIHK